MSEQASDFLALTLEERVRRFNLGTPTALHICTHELVNDLWRELESMSRQPADANPSRPVRQHSGDRSAHTPGPWKIDDRSLNPHIVCDLGINVAMVARIEDKSCAANARLIAAAPNMLAELYQCTTEIEEAAKLLRHQYPSVSTLYEAAAKRTRALIAKATGA